MLQTMILVGPIDLHAVGGDPCRRGHMLAVLRLEKLQDGRVVVVRSSSAFRIPRQETCFYRYVYSLKKYRVHTTNTDRQTD